jgi:hypothetical protein
MKINEHFEQILSDVEELKNVHMKQTDEFVALHDVRTATLKAQEIFKRNGTE